MAHIIFDNMIRALQDMSDAHIEETNVSYGSQAAWLTAAIADTWQYLHGNNLTEDGTVQHIPRPAEVAPEAATEKAAPTVTTTRAQSPPKPPAPLSARVVDALPEKTVKLGIAANGRPPAFKRKAAATATATAPAPVVVPMEEPEPTVVADVPVKQEPATLAVTFDAAYAAALSDLESKSLRVVDLKKELASLGLPQSGVKADLVHRLATAKANAATASTTPSASEPVADVTPSVQSTDVESTSIASSASAPAVVDVTSEPANDDAEFHDAAPLPDSPPAVAAPAPTAKPKAIPVPVSAKPPTAARRPPVLPPKPKRSNTVTAVLVADDADTSADTRALKRSASVSNAAIVAVPSTAAEDTVEAAAKQAAIDSAAAEAASAVEAAAKAAAEAETLAAAAAAREEQERRRMEAEAADAKAAEAARRKAEADAKAAEAERQARLQRQRERETVEAAKKEAERQQMKLLAESVQRLAEARKQQEEKRKATAATPASIAKPAISIFSTSSASSVTPSPSLSPVDAPVNPAVNTASTASAGAKFPPLPPSPVDADVSTASINASITLMPPPAPTPVRTVTASPGRPALVKKLEDIERLWRKQIDTETKAGATADVSIDQPAPSIEQHFKYSISAVATPVLAPSAPAITPATADKQDTPAHDTSSASTVTFDADKENGEDESAKYASLPLVSSQSIGPSLVAKSPFTPAATIPANTASAPAPAPVKPATPAKPAENNDYEMSEGEEEDDGGAALKGKAPAKHVPSWARGDALEAALKRQFGGERPMDPDAIFGDVPPCDLSMIFKRKNAKYHRRNSSGNWAADKLTDKEKEAYAKSIGLV